MLEFKDNENNTYRIEKAYHIQKQCDLLAIEKESVDGKLVKKYIKVVKDSNNRYTYQIQKTQVKAIRGINGLYDHFFECLTFGFGIEVWVISPINKMLEEVKEVA